MSLYICSHICGSSHFSMLYCSHRVWWGLGCTSSHDSFCSAAQWKCELHIWLQSQRSVLVAVMILSHQNPFSSTIINDDTIAMIAQPPISMTNMEENECSSLTSPILSGNGWVVVVAAPVILSSQCSVVAIFGNWGSTSTPICSGNECWEPGALLALVHSQQ